MTKPPSYKSGDVLPLDDDGELLDIDPLSPDLEIIEDADDTPTDENEIAPREAARIIAAHLPDRDDPDYRRVAFELALLLGPENAVKFQQFASTVVKYVDA